MPTGPPNPAPHRPASTTSPAATDRPGSPRHGPRRILIVRPSALGDVCRSVHVAAGVRRAHPQARIDWLVRDTFADAVRGHPCVDRVVPFPRQRFGRLHDPRVLAELLRWAGALRDEHYDIAIDCQGLFRSGWFTRRTKAPRRLGYPDAREFAWLGLTQRVQAPRGLHAVDRMMCLALAAGAEPTIDLRLRPPAEDGAHADTDPALREPYLLLAPTSIWPGKRWPGERFALLARRALDDPSLGIARAIVVGGPGEHDQLAPELRSLMADDPRVIDLVGATSIGRLMAVIARARAVVANDSAVLHMGVGLARPLVALFGPTRTALVGPYRRDDCVLQHATNADRFDHKDDHAGRAMMARIGVDEAHQRLADQLRQQPHQPVYRVLNPSGRHGLDPFKVELDLDPTREPAGQDRPPVHHDADVDRA